MREDNSFLAGLDIATVFVYTMMVLFGWLNIYAVVYDAEVEKSIFDFSLNSGKQLFFIGVALVVIIAIFIIDYHFFEEAAYVSYAGSMLLLVAVLLFGREIAGSKSWFDFGLLRFQPAELAKAGVALGLAKYLHSPSVKFLAPKSLAVLSGMLLLPIFLVLQQGDMGSALVFFVFILVFYREGLPHLLMLAGLWTMVVFVAALFFLDDITWLLVLIEAFIFVLGAFLVWIGTPKARLKIAGIALGVGLFSGLFAGSVGYFVSDVLKPHQRKRIEVMIKRDDPRGIGYQVSQSMIAIGSGGFAGKGFLKGTQTKFDFVPDQSTDFIFCTIGEEHGWLGSLFLIGLYVALMSRILTMAERQKHRFNRVYGYCVFSVFFFHFIVNLGMTIGLVPVIGIPLPFFSYGGSSLISFTILLFILVKLDAHRKQMLMRD